MSREGKVYVGNLPPDVKQRDIEDLFYKFGKINNINLKNTTQQPFAFLEFDDPRYVCDWLLNIDTVTVYELINGLRSIALR